MLQGNYKELFRSHGDIVEGLMSYYQKYRAVPDTLVLQDKFRDFDPQPVSGTAQYYYDKLREEYLAQHIRKLTLRAAESLKTDASPRVLQEMLKDIVKLQKFTDNVRDIDLTDFGQAEEYFEQVRERALLMGGSVGIPTGFRAIDTAYATGMAPGHLIVCIGWPGRGKTFLTSYFACKAWELGFKPMIVSLEMSPEDLRSRIYALMGSGLFRISEFQKGMVNVDDFHAWGRKKFDNKQSFTIVSSEGSSDVTPNTVQAKIDQHRPSLVICDYHQLFADNKGSGSEVERNKNISREFKQLAMSNKLPLMDITAATMDDISDQDHPPLLSQVAWSKAIEYDADMAFAVHRHTDTNLIELVCRKNRHGTDFAVYLDVDLDKGIIRENFDAN